MAGARRREAGAAHRIVGRPRTSFRVAQKLSVRPCFLLPQPVLLTLWSESGWPFEGQRPVVSGRRTRTRLIRVGSSRGAFVRLVPRRAGRSSLRLFSCRPRGLVCVGGWVVVLYGRPMRAVCRSDVEFAADDGLLAASSESCASGPCCWWCWCSLLMMASK
jgi:hypothetical protein